MIKPPVFSEYLPKRQKFLEMRSDVATQWVASGFKVAFEIIVVLLVLLSVLVAIPILLIESELSGTGLLLSLGMLALNLVVIVIFMGVIALQIRNNDLLMDIRDGQRELNGTMREFVRLARKDAGAP